MRAIQIAQRVKAPAAEEGLSSIPRTHRKERTGPESCPLTATCKLWYGAHPHTDSNAYTHNK